MRKRIYVSIIMLIFCCIFTNTIFATSTTISIDIYEININCGKYGSFSISGDNYSGTQSFRRRKGDSIEIKIIPYKNYDVGNITVDTESDILLGTNSISIENITSNVDVDVTFKINKSNSTSSNKKEETSNVCDGIHNCISNSYIDVDTQEWYHLNLDYVIENGLMKGTGNRVFEPYSPTTRAMIVTVLYRLEEEPVVEKQKVFDDVELETWYADAIKWASEEGIVLGYGDGNFGPDDYITREQMVAILYRYTKYKKGTVSTKYNSSFNEFDDIDDVSTYAYTPMRWATSQGIILGDNNRLLPQGISERCQIAAMLHRFCTNIIK